MKYEVFFIIAICIVLFAGCVSTGLHDNGNAATEVRGKLDQIRIEQTELAGTGERIRSESAEIESGIGKISATVEGSSEYYNAIRGILDEIRRSGQTSFE